jgi:hypothetical protein
MGNYNQLIIVLFITLVILVTPLFFIGFDFWAGTRKAKLRRERITSDKWKRTTTKIARYYNMLLALMVLDAMQIMGFWYLNNFSGWSAPLFPFIVFAGAVFVGAIEVKSIMEPANEKERRDMKQVATLAAEIAKNKTEPEEIAKAIADYLNLGKEERK